MGWQINALLIFKDLIIITTIMYIIYSVYYFNQGTQGGGGGSGSMNSMDPYFLDLFIYFS